MALTRREFLVLGGAALAAASCAGPGVIRLEERPMPRVPVLLYHDISDEYHDPYTISPALFSAQMEWLYSSGYEAVTFGEAARMEGDRKAVIITFDDGYASFMEYAFPLFRGYGFRSNINIIGGLAGKFVHLGGNRPLLSWDEYRFLKQSGLVEFGCHTQSLHVAGGVTQFPEDRLREDLLAFNRALERETGRTTDVLAWPYGIYDRKSVRAAKDAGFRFLLTVKEGFLFDGDFDEVPRLNIGNSLDLISFQQYLGGV
ncbi:MAG: polysaccharide deacetylase family protein [Thermodesulfovibrionales bacterium]